MEAVDKKAYESYVKETDEAISRILEMYLFRRVDVDLDKDRVHLVQRSDTQHTSIVVMYDGKKIGEMIAEFDLVGFKITTKYTFTE